MMEGILLIGIIAFMIHLGDCARLMMKSGQLTKLMGEKLHSEVQALSPKLYVALSFVLVERDDKKYLRTQLHDIQNAEPSLLLTRDVRRMLPLFLLGIGLLIEPAEQVPALAELTRPVFLGISLFAFFLQGISERKYEHALQIWLSTVYKTFPLLPEGTGGTKEVLQQLSGQYQEMQTFNQNMLKKVEKSQKILANLSNDLQTSFKKSVDERLAPPLEEMTKLAVQSQTNSRRFVEESTQKQNQAVQAMIAQVMQGIDQAIGQNLRDTSESFATSVQRQQVSMDRWRRSIDSVSEVISTLEGATRAVTLGAEKMAKAAEPVETAANVFAASAAQLEQALPAIADVANIYQNSQEMLEESHKAIADGTKEYKDIAGTIEKMVQGLQNAHQSSIQTISKGVDEAILNSMKMAGEQLTTVQRAQVESLTKWNNVSGNLNITMGELQETANSLSIVSKELVNASEPTVKASKYFFDASLQLKESIGPLQETVQMHQAGKEALQVVVDALREESERYGASAKIVHGIVDQLETTQHDILVRLQEQLDKAIANNLVRASEVLEKSVDKVANQLETSGEKTAQSLEQSLNRSSLEMTTSLREARKQLTDSLSDTINQFEHALSSASDSLIENWGETGRTIQEAMEHSSQVLDQSVQEVGKKLNIRVDEAGRSLEMSAEVSAKSIRDGAKEAKDLLSNVGGDWSKSIQVASGALRESAEQAGDVLQKSFDGVEERLNDSIGNIGKEMANDLKNVHQQYAHSLDYSTRNLRELADLQAGHSEGWKELLDNLKPALANLKTSTQELNEVMHGLHGSVAPVQEASLNFKEASNNITAVFPNISDTAKSYKDFNLSLIQATQSLSTTAVQYADAGHDMADLLTNIQRSMGLQDRSNQAVNQTLTQAEQTIRSLEPVTASMRQAAGDIRLISEQTTNTVDTIQKAASAQNQTVQQMGKLSAQLLKTIGMQSNRLNQVTEQMSLLQEVLTHGVQAFAKTLPKSVDQTLVNFDQALGEGVARLGIAIERLREAMDDLIEELEMRK